jgi:hypothetical protein
MNSGKEEIKVSEGYQALFVRHPEEGGLQVRTNIWR